MIKQNLIFIKLYVQAHMNHMNIEERCKPTESVTDPKLTVEPGRIRWMFGLIAPGSTSIIVYGEDLSNCPFVSPDVTEYAFAAGCLRD